MEESEGEGERFREVVGRFLKDFFMKGAATAAGTGSDIVVVGLVRSAFFNMEWNLIVYLHCL